MLSVVSPLRYDLAVGTRRHLIEANAGRVLLSLKQDREIDLIVSRTGAEPGAPKVKRSLVHEQVARIRADGYSFVHGRVVPGASILAVPLVRPESAVRLATGIAGPTARLQNNLQHNLSTLRDVLGNAWAPHSQNFTVVKSAPDAPDRVCCAGNTLSTLPGSARQWAATGS